MASLTLTVGAVSASAEANNTKASNILAQYAAAIGAEGTNQQKADAVVASLVRHIQDVARKYRHDMAQSEAFAALQAELNGLTWE